MNGRMRVLNYIKHREQGLYSKYRNKQLSLQQNLVTHNNFKIETIASSHSPSCIRRNAFLLVMSIDKSYFAVATSDNNVGIYCSISGELLYKLIGSLCPIYTITWHPYFKYIISSSNVSGSVFIWDLLQNDNKECNFIKVWNWSPFSSLISSIGFHPFRSIMTIARDREIRFIDWEKGHHIAHWRFYSEFSWVPWSAWSFVGSSIIVSMGNPQDESVLNSIINSIDIDQKAMSPVQCGCSHYNNNSLCEICDSCDKMSNLDSSPPKFEEYRVNAVDLIRYILSRPEDWFVKIFVCVNCRLRFKLWANSIELHNKYHIDHETSKLNRQLPHDVDANRVTVIEYPFAPEIVWNLLQKLEFIDGTDSRLKDFIIPKSDVTLSNECKNLLRCVAMFERECLRQSICWCCIQQIQNWVVQQEDFALFLYQAMIEVRSMVLQRIKHYDMSVFNVDHNKVKESSEGKIKSPLGESTINDENPLSEFSASDIRLMETKSDHNDANELFPDNPKQTNANNNSSQNDEHRVNVSSLSQEAPLKVFEEDSSNCQDDRQRKLAYFRMTLDFLQFYVSKPSRLGDLINIFLSNNLNHPGQFFNPSVNGSKVDSYCIRKWSLQPLGTTSQKISPRYDFNESNVVVPCLLFSGTGITETSIRISKCGRMIAVFVPQNSFKRIHLGESQINISVPRKRRYSLAFRDHETLHDFTGISNYPVIAIYSSEPETSCGQLLYYFEMPYEPISMDFSPLGDHLIVGISGSQTQAYLFWVNSKFHSQTNTSFVVGPPSGSQCNIGLILKINGKEEADPCECNSVSRKISRKMELLKIINHKRDMIYRDFNDLLGLNGPINCFIWNTAGGLLCSKEPGTLFSLSFVGCPG